MYAVIKTGGKQYRVEPGTTLRVEKLDGEKGKNIEINDVLLVADGDDVKIGSPMLAGAKGPPRSSARARRQARRLQVPSPEAVPSPERSPPAVHGAQDHEHHGLGIHDHGSQKRTGLLS